MNKEAEIFNPLQEYDIIRFLPDGEEKEEKKREFHKKRVEQKTEIATIAALLVEEVTKNPDIKDSELKNIVKEFAPEMQLSGYQKRIFNQMIHEFSKRQEAIKELQAFSNDPKKIFQRKFGRLPKRPVRVIFGPIVTHFILSDEDYEMVTGERKNENGVILKSAGAFMSLRPDITVGRATMSNKEATRKHEETHALKHMLDRVLGLDRFGLSFIKKIHNFEQQLKAAKDPRTKAHIAEQILGCYIDKNGEQIKHEIFANIREGEKSSIVETLARSANHLGLYDYSEQDRKQLLKFIEREISPADRVLVEEVIKNFSSLNKSRIREAVDAVTILTKKHGFTPEMVIFFLNDVPLSLWGKEVARLKDIKQVLQ